MTPRFARTLGFATFALALIALASGADREHRTLADAYSCVSRPSEIRELGFSTRGTVGALMVKPGDRVKAGDELVRLVDDVQRQQVEVARIQAEDDSTVRQGEALVEFRKVEVQKLKEARASDAGTDAQLREAIYRASSAELELAQATNRFRLNRATLAREEAQLREMAIRAPIDGVVLEVLKRGGETVDESKPVLTIVSVNPLRVDVDVPTRDAAEIAVGQGVEIVWDDIDDKTPMAGKVTYKAPAGDLGARRIQLRVEAPNPNEIPSGMHGKLRFLPKDAGEKPPPNSPNKAPTGGKQDAVPAGPAKK